MSQGGRRIIVTAGGRWIQSCFAIVYLVGSGVVRAAEVPQVDPAAAAAAERGRPLYAQYCASCHDQPTGRTPHREALLFRAPVAVLRALEQGAMRPMARGIAREDLPAIVAYLTGALPQSQPIPKPIFCRGRSRPSPVGPDDWPDLGRDLANTRYAPRSGIDAQDVAKLELDFAFAIPGGAAGPVSVVGDRIYLAAGTGEVMALDAKTGCTHWTHPTERLVRSVSVATLSNGRTLVFFGDGRAFATALDARTGKPVWSTAIEEHALAKVTAAPSVFGDRVYVPMSTIEDPLQHVADYPCCTSRGSVSALDAETGKILWKQYTVRDEPKPLKDQPGSGPKLSAPAGGAVFTPLTLDPKRGAVYAATAASYDDGYWPDAQSVVAYDMQTGARRWARMFKTPEAVEACRKSGTESDCRNNFDFAAPAVLQTLPNGKEILIAAQKNGMAHGLDPDAEGAVLWTTRYSKGTDLGGLMYGMASDGRLAYLPISDTPHSFAQPPGLPGGLAALDPSDGVIRWLRPAEEPTCAWGSEHCLSGSIAAASAIPGVVFQSSSDGWLRARATGDGELLWRFDTAQPVAAVNGVEARGGQLQGWTVVAANGALFVVSGASTQAEPGNALLVFRVPPPH